MKKIVKHTISCTAFISGLLVLLILASYILVPKSNARDDGMQDPSANGILSEPKDTIDVLVLGDSESYCAINPLKIWEDYGITSYCCGTAGQKLCYSQELLQKAFKNQSFKVVVLETDAIFRRFTLSDALLHKINPLVSVFSYHNRWKSLKAQDLKFSINYTYIDNTKGYRFTTNVAPASTEGYMERTKKKAHISAQNRSYVEDIRKYCEENGAKLILVSTPSTVNWKYTRHNGVQKLARDLKIEYIDMNTLPTMIPIDWNNDTRDRGDHLNHFGAEKASAYLGRYLFNTGLFRNHREEAKYKRWNDALENFNNKIAAVQTN